MNKCKDCHYFQNAGRNADNTVYGSCYRYPSQVTDGGYLFSSRPRTKDDDFCGEWLEEWEEEV